LVEGAHRMPQPIRVLFLCTGNSARSIMAEAYLNGAGDGRFVAYSAGSHPQGRVNPFALELLASRGLDTTGLRSKSWDAFAQPGAPAIDFVLTVCDQAAGEACPVWPGRPASAHWGVDDPAKVAGSDAQKRAAFARAFAALKTRIDLLLAARIESLEPAAAATALAEIAHRAEGAQIP
jgi:protein-tyrosine-phosphatase